MVMRMSSLDEEAVAQLVALRHRLHAVAEVSLKEERTKAYLLDFLREHTHLEIVDRGQWFYARYRGTGGAGPLALRADFDAVLCQDGCARHLCGHDGHSTILAGLALQLARLAPARDVYLLFQPAEEIGEGAKLCQGLLQEQGITEIYGLHNIPGYDEGEILLLPHTFACASTGMELIFTGTPAHAAYPEQGKNPTLVMARVISYLHELVQAKHRGVVLGTVIGMEAGSSSYGVSAEQGCLRLTLRAEYQEEYDALVGNIQSFAQAVAAASGLGCGIRFIEPFPATENHPQCVARVRRAAEALQLRVTTPPEPFRWSEDFGYYLQATPGAMFGVGCGRQHPGLHTRDYEFNDGIIADTVALLGQLVTLP